MKKEGIFSPRTQSPCPIHLRAADISWKASEACTGDSEIIKTVLVMRNLQSRAGTEETDTQITKTNVVSTKSDIRNGSEDRDSASPETQERGF